MARQNIDEQWKSDPRRTALVERLGNGRLADGMRVEVNWLLLDHKGKAIPLKKFQFIKNWQDWIDCGLGEAVGEDVRIAGADAYQEFFEKQFNNGKKGGRPKKTKNPKKPKETQDNPTVTQKKPNNPSSSSSISSSISSSDSSSISNSSNSTNAAIAAYCQRFKIRWGTNPHIGGKEQGIAGRLAKGMSPERFGILLDAYFSMPDAGVVKAKHPLNLFELKMNEVTVWADSGEFTTQRQANQADTLATVTSQLQRIREGKL